jgi:hypothetical protein
MMIKDHAQAELIYASNHKRYSLFFIKRKIKEPEVIEEFKKFTKDASKLLAITLVGPFWPFLTLTWQFCKTIRELFRRSITL